MDASDTTCDQEPEQGPLLSTIPSLAVDYDELDASDPDWEFTWLQSLAVFGFSERARDDPRYKALSKLKLLTQHHGLGDLKLVDYYRAYVVYAAASVKQSRQPRQAPRPPRRNATQSAPDLSFTLRNMLMRNGNTTSDSPSRFWSRSRVRRVHESGPSSAPPPTADSHSFETPQPSEDEDEENETVPPISCTTSQPSPATASIVDSTVTTDHVRLIYHMLRHAESIYGLPLTMASAPLVSLTKISRRGITEARNGLSDDDVVYSRFTATTFMPANYVAVDRGICAVVVCIRGTANLLDSLTDVAATYDPLSVRRMLEDGQVSGTDDLVHGFCHAGVVRSARNVFEEIRQPLLDALRANPGFELLITGHSLGGATAAVLSLIMRDDDEFPHALAVCIAPPPCLSLELAEETMTTAVTVVNGADIVPRLSIPVLLPYLATARYVADLSPRKRMLVGWGMSGLAVEWDKLIEECEKWVSKLREQHQGKQLFIPGAVFHLVRPRDTETGLWSKSAKHVEMVATDRQEFAHGIGRGRGLFLGHAPSSYRSKLNAVLRSMGAEKLTKPRGAGHLRVLTRVPKISETDDRVVENRKSLHMGRRSTSQESVDGVVRDLFQRGLSQRTERRRRSMDCIT